MTTSRDTLKNIAGIFAYSTEENFKAEGRPKWQDLAETTKKQRAKKGKYPGQILQVKGKLAASVSTYYDDDSAVIGSNLPYAAIHQLGGKAGKRREVTIPARPYLKLTEADCQEISPQEKCENFKTAFMQELSGVKADVLKLANTNMDKVISKNKDLENRGKHDLSMLEELKTGTDNETIYLFETDKILAEEHNKTLRYAHGH